MTPSKTLTFATANLFNFVEPPNAYYDFENIYDCHGWSEKCRWTKEKLIELNADVVGVQEVFSIDAAASLFADLGYPHFVTVDTPHIAQEYIYSQPVVAVASRYPIKQVSEVTLTAWVNNQYSSPFTHFNRKPVQAVIELPDIGEVAVYVCHLKSQRATEAIDAEQENNLVGRWLSSQQRGWEAVMLRLFMEQAYHAHPIPTVLLGDMNQPLHSDITGLLTTHYQDDPTRLSLTDSWTLFNATCTDKPRQPTHYHFAKGNVLDYAILSQEFQPDSQYSLAEVSGYKVLDHHLINPSFEHDKYASDHAFVAVTVTLLL